MCRICISLSLSHTGDPHQVLHTISFEISMNVLTESKHVKTMSVQYSSRVASPDKPKSWVIESKLERRSTVWFDWLMYNSPNQRIKRCRPMMFLGESAGFSYPMFDVFMAFWSLNCYFWWHPNFLTMEVEMARWTRVSQEVRRIYSRWLESHGKTASLEDWHQTTA